MPKLVTCKSCEAQISTNAAYSYYCPHCGQVYRRTFFQTYGRFLWMMLALLVVGFGYALIAS
jgi:uncharacterized paraquat-inducible protein A